MNPRKLAIAARLRKETTLPIQWIAERLPMGSTGRISVFAYPQGTSH